MPNPNIYNEIQQLKSKMEAITRLIEDKKEPLRENKQDNSFMNKNIRLESINGLFQTVSSVPTHTPRNFKEQIVLVDSGSITKMYVRFGSSWRLQRFYNT